MVTSTMSVESSKIVLGAMLEEKGRNKNFI